jgi:transposase InsO family protein
MVGLLKTAPSGFTHLLVAVDKFTKWVEAKPIRKLDGKTALKFIKDIVVRFGIPHSIITDNGSNLSKGEVEEYCRHNGIRLDLASVAHQRSNGQVERTNGLILSGIKPHLEAPLH